MDSFDDLAGLVWTNAGNQDLLLKFRDRIVNAKNQFGDSLLHIAAYEGNESVVSALIELGIGVNLQNDFGSTAIQGGAFAGNIPIMSALLTAGADLSIRDCTDTTCRENILNIAGPHIKKWIEDHIPPPQEWPAGGSKTSQDESEGFTCKVLEMMAEKGAVIGNDAMSMQVSNFLTQFMLKQGLQEGMDDLNR